VLSYRKMVIKFSGVASIREKNRSTFSVLLWVCIHLFAGDVEAVNLQSFDVSVIANMVKKYLRELRDPVIPEDSYSSYIEAASMYTG